MERTERSRIQIGNVKFYDTCGASSTGVPSFIVYTGVVLRLTFANC